MSKKKKKKKKKKKPKPTLRNTLGAPWGREKKPRRATFGPRRRARLWG